MLPVGQPGAPASSKVCLHGSFVGGCESVTLSHAHSMGVEAGLEVTADFCFAHRTALRVFQGR